MTESWQAAYLQHVMEIIARNGWAVQGVFSHDGDATKNLAYTVGLLDRDLPEFMVRGLAVDGAHALLNDLARDAVYGCARHAAGDETTALGQLVRFAEVPDPGATLSVARVNAEVEGKPLRALEVIVGG